MFFPLSNSRIFTIEILRTSQSNYLEDENVTVQNLIAKQF